MTLIDTLTARGFIKEVVENDWIVDPNRAIVLATAAEEDRARLTENNIPFLAGEKFTAIFCKNHMSERLRSKFVQKYGGSFLHSDGKRYTSGIQRMIPADDYEIVEWEKEFPYGHMDAYDEHNVFTFPIAAGTKVPMAGTKWKDIGKSIPIAQGNNVAMPLRSKAQRKPLFNVDPDCAKTREFMFLLPPGLDIGRKGICTGRFYAYDGEIKGNHADYGFTQLAIEKEVAAEFGIEKVDPEHGYCLIEGRSSGKYNVVPPSIHPSGEHYEWLTETGFFEEPPLKTPDEMREIVRTLNLIAFCGFVLMIHGGSCRSDKAGVLARALCNDFKVDCETALSIFDKFKHGEDEKQWQHERDYVRRCYGADGNDPHTGGIGEFKEHFALSERALAMCYKWRDGYVGKIKKGRPKEQVNARDVLNDVLGGITIFRGELNRFYASLSPRRNIALTSDEFHYYVKRRVVETSGKVLSRDKVKDVVDLAIAMNYHLPAEDVAMRVASHGGKSYLALYDVDDTVLEIDGDGVRKCEMPPVRIVRTPIMTALPVPADEGHLDELNDFMNLQSADARLIALAWAVKCLISPKSDHPVCAVQGFHGTGKSTFLKHLVGMIDPTDVITAAGPRDEDDLVTYAQDCYIFSCDNLSGFSAELSDAMCRLSTGGGMRKRKLYTDGEPVVTKIKRPAIFSGIDLSSKRGDLVSRYAFIDLEEIKDGTMEDDEVIAMNFIKARPRLLRALLNLVSAVIKKLPDVKKPRTNRMVAFMHIGEAVSDVLGFSQGHFVALMDRQQETALGESADNEIALKLLQRRFESMKDLGLGNHELDLGVLLQWMHDVADDERLPGRAHLPKNTAALSRLFKSFAWALECDDYRLVHLPTKRKWRVEEKLFHLPKVFDAETVSSARLQ